MKATQERTLDAGRRVQGFLDTQAAAIGTAVSASLRAKLDAAVSQVAEFQSEQDTSKAAARGETATQKVLRSDLYKHFVAPIGHAAKIALRDAPDFPALVVPAVAEHRGDFVMKVNSLIDAAAKYEKVFIDHGMPADFLVRIRAAVVQVSASADARARQLSRQSAATAGLKTADKSVRDLFRLLNGVLSPVLKNKPALTADWIASKRIRQITVTPLPTGGTITTGVVPMQPPAAAGTPSGATPPAVTTPPVATPPAA